MEPASVPLDEAAAAAKADPPAGDGTDLVPDDSGEDDGDIGRDAGGVPAGDVHLVCASAPDASAPPYSITSTLAAGKTASIAISTKMATMP